MLLIITHGLLCHTEAIGPKALSSTLIGPELSFILNMSILEKERSIYSIIRVFTIRQQSSPRIQYNSVCL